MYAYTTNTTVMEILLLQCDWHILVNLPVGINVTVLVIIPIPISCRCWCVGGHGGSSSSDRRHPRRPFIIAIGNGASRCSTGVRLSVLFIVLVAAVLSLLGSATVERETGGSMPFVMR